MDAIKLRYWKPWFLSLTAMLAVSAIMLLGPKYKVEAMLKLEFSKSIDAFLGVIDQYDYSDELLIKYIYLDFIYILTLSALFCMSLELIFELTEIKRKNRYLLVCLIPGLFDIVENLLMLQMINNNGMTTSGFNFFIAVVIIKWTTVIPFILLSLLILAYQILIRIAKIYRYFENR